MPSRPAEFVTRVVSWIPFAWSALLLLLALRTRIYLSHWPRPLFPDPKRLPFTTHYQLLDFSLFAVIGSIVLMLVLAFGARRQVSRAVQRRALIVFTAGWALIFAMSFFPPFDFVMWFLD